jgi:hypothetical protein
LRAVPEDSSTLRDSPANGIQGEDLERKFVEANVLRLDSALVLDQATIDGGVLFTDGFKAFGEVRLVGAIIGGRLLIDAAQFTKSGWRNEDGPALVAQAAVIRGRLDLNDVESDGAINFAGITVHQSIRFRYVHARTRRGPALSLSNVTVHGDMHFGDEKPSGESLYGLGPPGKLAAAPLFYVAQSQALSERFHNIFYGGIIASYADIHGRFSILKAHVEVTANDIEVNLRDRFARWPAALSTGLLPPDDRQAIQLYSTKIGGSCLMKRCLFIGETNLYGIRIATNLEMDGSTCINPFGHALVLQNAEIKGHAELSSDLTIDSDRRVTRLATLPLSKLAKLAVALRKLISAPPLRSQALNPYAMSPPISHADAQRKFVCLGKLRASDIDVGGRLSLDGAVMQHTLDEPDLKAPDIWLTDAKTRWLDEANAWRAFGLGDASTKPSAPTSIKHYDDLRPACLELVRARVQGGLELTYFSHKPIGDIDLRDARVGYLDDDANSISENECGRILLNGFRYRALGFYASTDATLRIAWLKKQWDGGEPGSLFRSQPYEQIRAVLLASGHEDAAYRIAVHERKLQRDYGGKGPFARIIDWMYWATLRYGYYPSHAIVVSALLVAVGWGGGRQCVW